METLQEKIKFYSDQFESKKRTSTGENIVILKDNAPEELKKAVQDAHGERLPDDWIYGTFADLMQRLTEYEVDGPDDVDEYRAEIVDGMVDIYNKDLTNWLNESYYNVEACNEAEANLGFGGDDINIIDRIKRGQYWAIDQVFGCIVSLLETEE